MLKKCFAAIVALFLLTMGIALAEDTLVIPANVVQLEDESFQDTGARVVVLPEGIDYIGANVFAGMPLQQINLPASLNYIAPGAFAGCDDLVAAVEPGSYALTYCIENGVAYTLTEEEQPSSGESYHDYQTQSSEMGTFCVQRSQSAVDLNVLSNCFDCLLTNDASGAIVGAAAKRWYSNDGSVTWTFELNDGMVWVDYQGNVMANVMAEDYARAVEWILNYHKNGGANVPMLNDNLAGASAYYHYTEGLSAEEALALTLDDFYSMVGVQVSGNTITFTCTGPTAYFPSIACYSSLSPISGALLDNLGVEGYLNVTYDQLWYNGPYTITYFEDRVKKILTKNPHYHDRSVSLYGEVVILMTENSTQAYDLFEDGELDQVTLTNDVAEAIYNDPTNPYYPYLTTQRSKYSYQLHFNYDKHLADGSTDTNWNTAVANENFRKALYYGIDLTDWLAQTNAIAPQSAQNYGYTASNLVSTTDGRDYCDLVLDRIELSYNMETYTRYDGGKAAAYKASAIQELTTAGVSLPVQADYYIVSGSTTAMNSAEVLKQCFEAQLGDMVQLNILTYNSSLAQEVRNPRLHSFMINGWGADYADPSNFLGQETLEENAYYTEYYSFANESSDASLRAVYETFTGMVQAARAINDDYNARCEAFADAEAYLIEHCLTIPMYYNTTWVLSRAAADSKINVGYGSQSTRYVNWRNQ